MQTSGHRHRHIVKPGEDRRDRDRTSDSRIAAPAQLAPMGLGGDLQACFINSASARGRVAASSSTMPPQSGVIDRPPSSFRVSSLVSESAVIII